MHVWALGLSCETPMASGPPGFSHDNPRTPNVHIRVSQRLQKHHQNSTRRHPERHKKSEMRAGEEKKSAEFWASHPSTPHPSGPHPFGAPPFGPSNFSLGSRVVAWVWERGRGRNSYFYPCCCCCFRAETKL